jgi:D-serine dehydratase
MENATITTLIAQCPLVEDLIALKETIASGKTLPCLCQPQLD